MAVKTERERERERERVHKLLGSKHRCDALTKVLETSLLVFSHGAHFIDTPSDNLNSTVFALWYWTAIRDHGWTTLFHQYLLCGVDDHVIRPLFHYTTKNRPDPVRPNHALSLLLGFFQMWFALFAWAALIMLSYFVFFIFCLLDVRSHSVVSVCA